MNSDLFKKSFLVLWPLTLVISVYYFLRGHNEPGGGFIGGLIFALALILKDASRAEHQTASLADLGVLLGGCCGILILTVLSPIFFGKEVLTGLWTAIPIPIAGKFSSILIFDLAIFLIVGIANLYIFRTLGTKKKETT